MRWTRNKDEHLKRLWQEGRMIKSISAELGGFSPSSIKARRRVLGLQPRRSPEEPAEPKINLYMTEGMLSAVRRRAFEVGASMPEYIRGLIRRDIGIDPPVSRPRKIAVHQDRVDEIVVFEG